MRVWAEFLAVNAGSGSQRALKEHLDLQTEQSERIEGYFRNRSAARGASLKWTGDGAHRWPHAGPSIIPSKLVLSLCGLQKEGVALHQ